MFAVKPQTSSWTSAHAQGYFSATILMLVAFDGFTLSPRMAQRQRRLATQSEPMLRTPAAHRARKRSRSDRTSVEHLP
jgi:hypothetical protein